MNDKNSLSAKYPDIANEWDSDKNGDLKPDDVTYGSNLNVSWICPICHHSYKKKISNRTAPSKQNTIGAKCPICLGRVIIPGFNSLKAKYTKIVNDEWDFDKNNIDPDTIPPHRNKPKYWWKCSKGHSYEASANNKTSQTGGNCPYCSSQKFSIEKSLAKCNPILAKEWHFEKNKLSPEEVFVNSNKEAWWKCIRGHSWKAKINNRNNGKGCSECSKGTHTSIPELIVYHYIHQLFKDAVNGYKYKGKEIDIYIPSLNVGIEYDGEYYHKTIDKYTRDRAKTEFLVSKGVHLIRIRESKCYPMENDICEVFSFIHTCDYRYLKPALCEVLNQLCDSVSIKNTTVLDFEPIKYDIIKTISRVPYEESFAAFFDKNSERIDSIWDQERNDPLTPEMFRPYSDQYVYWICKKNPKHKRYAPIKSISRFYGCDWCVKKHRYTTEEWIDEAIEKHGKDYDYSKVDYLNAKTPIDIICPKHGIFSQLPSEHLAGKGCKWCGSQGGFHECNTLAYCYPELSKEWDYEHPGNKGLTPEDVVITDNQHVYWWKCNNGKPHSYYAKISSRIRRKSRCAICHGKQIAYDTSLKYQRPDLLAEWSDDNILKPSEVSCGSEKKVVWKCRNSDHKPYSTSVYSRARLNSGCPECAGNLKTPLVYKKEFNEKHPNIELLSNYVKSSKKIFCRCLICGYEWQPFPFNVLKGKGCPKCRITK